MAPALRRRINGQAVVESQIDASSRHRIVSPPLAQLRPVSRTTTTGQSRDENLKKVGSSDNRVKKPKRRSKQKVIKRQMCSICQQPLFLNRFPKKLPTDVCGHENDACRKCIRKWITEELNETGPERFACITCGIDMEDEDVKFHADRSTYKRIQKQLARIEASKTPNFHFCQAPHCDEGQIHHDIHKPFACTSCSEVSCVSCGGSWHNDKTCAQNKAKDKTVEEQTEKSFKTLGFKMCPNKQCAIRIEKVDGCNHMFCSGCETEFCWLCLQVWTSQVDVGTLRHRPGCSDLPPAPPPAPPAQDGQRCMATAAPRRGRW